MLSFVLLAVSVFLSFKHGWDSLNFQDHPESARMLSELGIRPTHLPVLGIFTIVTGLLLLFPRTFFLGNLLTAFSIVTIMALALNAGHPKIALLEIPFLIMPMVMIWLEYPTWNFTGKIG